MQISVICQTVDMKNVAGFSLIELSVVLALISLATAIVVPNLFGAFQSVQAQSELEEVFIQISSLGYTAYSQGRTIHINEEEIGKWVKVPEGWEVEILDPFKVRMTGFCQAGTLRFLKDEFSRQIQVTVPHCHVVDG